MIRYRIKPGKQGLCFVGFDPTGTGAFLSCPLAQLSQATLAAWMAQDRAKASKYIETHSDSEKQTTAQPSAPGQAASPRQATGKKKGKKA